MHLLTINVQISNQYRQHIVVDHTAMDVDKTAAISQHTIIYILEIVNKHKHKKVVLQIGKQKLGISFDLVSQLRKKCNGQIEFYVLYDSMKKSCCTDIIGAKHIDYDALFHFGYACFSEKYDPRHYYILPEIGSKWAQLQQAIKSKQTIALIKTNQINVILCDQSVYARVRKFKQFLFQQANVEVAHLPFDQSNSNYLGFSYYCDKLYQKYNILVIKPESKWQSQEDNPTSELLLENLQLCKNSLKIQKIYTLTPSHPITEFNSNSSKRLLQRISQISELQNYQTFGILVSNPSTQFCQQQIKRVRQLLDSKKLKHFTFMMNNLNECKLGNFPQIEVYVIIACHNYSLYSKKDFYRLVVVPYDIQIAFRSGKYESYQFDLNTKQGQIPKNQQIKQKNIKTTEQQDRQTTAQRKTQAKVGEIVKINNQIAVQSIIQTLDFYRNRGYKGLQFSEKKQVQPIKLGKVGIATQYTPITQKNGENK